VLVLAFLIAALGAAALYLVVERVGKNGLPLAALRALVWGGVAALLINPACRRAIGGTTVLLDASISMSDADGDARWLAAVDSARALAGRRGRVVLFGEAPREWREGTRPDMTSSLLLPALGEAAARGGRLAVVTDGVVDDAGSIPAELLRGTRVVALPKPDRPDLAVAALDLPAALRAGDSATAVVDVAAAGLSRTESVTVALLELGREVARASFAASGEQGGVGGSGTYRRELRFLPASVAGQQEIRRYQAVVSGLADDSDPRNDRRETAVAVGRQSTIVLVTDSPDWDSRWLESALSATSGVPVRAFVRLGPGGYRDTRALSAVSEATVAAEARRAALLVAHGTPQGVGAVSRWASRALLRWPAQAEEGAGPPGDWYVAAPEFASPVGAALAGVPIESLPPLEAAFDVRGDSVAWTALFAQQGRRGRARAVLSGSVDGPRRRILVTGAGLWRWAGKGGVAAEAYRALVASMADWLLEEGEREAPALSALRDSLARGAGELVPRRPVLASQPGLASAAGGEPVPIRHGMWVYAVVLAALIIEWVGRKRRGLR
jgi:hypothetical protein